MAIPELERPRRRRCNRDPRCRSRSPPPTRARRRDSGRRGPGRPPAHTTHKPQKLSFGGGRGFRFRASRRARQESRRPSGSGRPRRVPGRRRVRPVQGRLEDVQKFEPCGSPICPRAGARSSKWADQALPSAVQPAPQAAGCFNRSLRKLRYGEVGHVDGGVLGEDGGCLGVLVVA